MRTLVFESIPMCSQSTVLDSKDKSIVVAKLCIVKLQFRLLEFICNK